MIYCAHMSVDDRILFGMTKEKMYNSALCQVAVSWNPLLDKTGFADSFMRQKEQMNMLGLHEKRGLRLIMSYL